MKKIILRRPLERVNKNFTYAILIENQKVAEIQNGEEKSIEISKYSNNLQLRAKIHWCGSEKIDLNTIENNQIIIIRSNRFLNRTLPIATMILFLGSILLDNLNIISEVFLYFTFIVYILVIIFTTAFFSNK